MIGAGSFAQNVFLPISKNSLNMIGVCTGSGNSAKYVGEKYGFKYATNKAEDLFKDKSINTIIIYK